MTVPADVSCIVPGCGRRHGRMCTFPVEGEMKTAWTSVLEAVYPTLDVNAPEPKLKLLCEVGRGLQFSILLNAGVFSMVSMHYAVIRLYVCCRVITFQTSI